MQLQALCRAQAKAALRANIQQTPGELPETLQYLAMYLYGLLKTPLVSPLTKVPAKN